MQMAICKAVDNIKYIICSLLRRRVALVTQYVFFLCVYCFFFPMIFFINYYNIKIKNTFKRLKPVGTYGSSSSTCGNTAKLKYYVDCAYPRQCSPH
jgi:hypothetical protein